MYMQKENLKQKAVFESLRSFYYATGESVSLNMTIYVKDDIVGSLQQFYDVDVELMMSRGDNCGIRIHCKDKEYEALGMKNSYSVKTAQFNYEERKDYQTSYKALKIQPNEFGSNFILLNAKGINEK